MTYTCSRCLVQHHAEEAVLDVLGRLLCRNSEQCSRRMGPSYSPRKALRLSLGGPVHRERILHTLRAIYRGPEGMLFCIGITPPNFPVGVTWQRYQVQRYIRTPKVLWCAVPEKQQP
jgi:hypothetical protein